MKVARPPQRRLILDVTRLSPSVRRKRREFRDALASVPKPVPWSWAEPRVLPLLSGPRLDDPDAPLIRVRSELGPAIEFGLPVGPWFGRVDRPVAQRWECTPEQLLAQAMRNLRKLAAELSPSAVRSGVRSGRQIAVLDEMPPWASSLVLDADALMRILGSDDQLIAAARTDCLLSMPLDTPSRVFSEIAVDFERQDDALWLDPFVLEHGRLRWIQTDEFDDDWSQD